MIHHPRQPLYRLRPQALMPLSPFQLTPRHLIPPPHTKRTLPIHTSISSLVGMRSFLAPSPTLRPSLTRGECSMHRHDPFIAMASLGPRYDLAMTLREARDFEKRLSVFRRHFDEKK